MKAHEQQQNKMSHLMTKPKKWHVRQAKTQISLGICPVWSESSLSAWRKLVSLDSHWVHSEDSDQTGQMPRLIWVFAGHTLTLLVLSWGSSITIFVEANFMNISIKFQLLPALLWLLWRWLLIFFCKLNVSVEMATNQIQQFRQNSYVRYGTTQGTFL